MAREKTLNSVPLPLPIICIATYRELVFTQRNVLRNSALQVAHTKDPSILPEPHPFTIVHNPAYVARYRRPDRADGSPKRGGASVGPHVWHLMQASLVLSSQHLNPKFLRMGHKIPSILHHVSIIENPQIPKSKSSFVLRFANLAPRDQMAFSSRGRATPDEISTNALRLLNNRDWEGSGCMVYPGMLARDD